MKEVLNTRFLLEHYYSAKAETKQKTIKKLRELTRLKEGLLPAMIIGETVRIICEKTGRREAGACYLLIITNGLQIRNLTPEIARQAGLLKCKYGDVPMGDCIIASTAMIDRAKIISDDPHFLKMKEIKSSWI